MPEALLEAPQTLVEAPRLTLEARLLLIKHLCNRRKRVPLSMEHFIYGKPE